MVSEFLGSKNKTCLIACSVLEEEIKKLISNDELDVDVVFISKHFHDDYVRLEKNLRPAIKNAPKEYSRKVMA